MNEILTAIFLAITTGVGSALFVCGIYYLILKIKGEL